MDKKTIGQIAHEAFAGIRLGFVKDWEDLNASTQNDYEVMAAAIVEECIKLIEKEREDFLSPEYATNQPHSSYGERFACNACIDALRSLKRSDKENEDE